ncbi:unnamed protein product [Calypogeia fissa]
MATGNKSGGSVGSHKPVPDWLNSSAWSRPPSSGAIKKANPYGLSENGIKAQGKNKAQQQNNVPDAGDNGDVASATDDPLSKQHVHSSQASRVGPVTSTVQRWPPLDSSVSDPPSDAHSSSSSESGQPSTKGSTSLNSRIEHFTIELSRKRIHIAELQRLSAQGIPDVGGLRSMSWKLLVGYLPRNREEWSAELAKKRAEYASFREELLVTPSELTRRKEAYENHLASNDDDGRGFLQRQDITHDDHPLSLGSTSVWHQYFQDSELSEQIDRDVKRTHPDIQFFCGDSNYAIENQEALKRALFIFAKLNPGIRYVQGMNEVLAPLYWVFKTDPDEEYSEHAEADSFFCFVELLSDFRDNFCQQLDNSAVGVRATLSQLNSLLRKCDEELWRHMELTAKVNPQFYAFRWITLLLTQEFDFPDCLRLWDSLLSNPNGPLEILLRVCVSMLLCVRSRLLAGDFTTNLKLLQNYPTVSIDHLLNVADELRR